MDDAISSTRSAPAESPADTLLATKLRIPRPRTGFVSRSRLRARVDDGVTRDLLLVCAPAGFGKTTLVADWAASTRVQVAWVSLDQSDNDPARFWRDVGAALDRLPGVSVREPVAGVADSRTADLDAAVAAFVSDLTRVDGGVALVLDDYHVISSDMVHASVGFLLDHLPEALHLVIASRADPPIALARARAAGRLTELRTADLRLTTDEAAALLHSTVGRELGPDAVNELTGRTEGWAAGLQLAALTLRDREDAGGFIRTFSGGHRFVLDYLTEEVLDRLSDDLRVFLMQTSVLERLTAALCDAVTGRTDSQQLLESIERANLFLVPLDDVRGWWRYHHLFAELLQVRLLRERPGEVHRLHVAAAAWNEGRGLTDDAINHALAAPDTGLAGRLIERHFDELLRRSELGTLQRWLDALPRDLIQSRPRLSLARAVMAVASGDVDTVSSALDDAERAAAASDGDAYEPSVDPATSLLANVHAGIAIQRAAVAHLRGDADATSACARAALGVLADGDRMLRSVGRRYLAVAEWLSGRLSEAERAFSASMRDWRTSGELSFVAWGSHYLGQVQQAQGRLGAAWDTYEQALTLSAMRGGPGLLARSPGLVGMAEVAYHRDDLETAQRCAVEGVTLARRLGYGVQLMAGLAVLARIRHHEGDPGGVAKVVEEALQVQPSPTVVTLLNPVPVLEAWLALADGEVGTATRWVERRELGIDDQLAYPRERDYLMLARVLLARHAFGQARQLLDRLHADAARQHRVASLIEIRALQALALEESGGHLDALTTLVDALALAADGPFVRLFVDEGAPMAALLAKLATAPTTALTAASCTVPPAFLDRVLTAVEHAGYAIGPRPTTAGLSRLVAPLTDRELEVLSMLASGRTNQAIADELVITLHTVKRHVTHILDKLGAANRTEAVSRARTLGLVA
jgi:LuxR family maltose regulon positive regulatory protein